MRLRDLWPWLKAEFRWRFLGKRYEVFLSEEAKKQIAELPEEAQRDIMKAVDRISKNPYSGGQIERIEGGRIKRIDVIERLQEELEESWKKLKMVEEILRDSPEIITAYDEWSTKKNPRPWVDPHKAAETLIKLKALFAEESEIDKERCRKNKASG